MSAIYGELHILDGMYLTYAMYAAMAFHASDRLQLSSSCPMFIRDCRTMIDRSRRLHVCTTQLSFAGCGRDCSCWDAKRYTTWKVYHGRLCE